jgi:hypothetical protein
LLSEPSFKIDVNGNQYPQWAFVRKVSLLASTRPHSGPRCAAGLVSFFAKTRLERGSSLGVNPFRIEKIQEMVSISTLRKAVMVAENDIYQQLEDQQRQENWWASEEEQKWYAEYQAIRDGKYQ